MKAQTSLFAEQKQTREKRERDKDKILLALGEKPLGLTREEISVLAEVNINTVNARIVDLRKEKKVVETGEYRVNERGCRCKVVFLASEKTISVKDAMNLLEGGSA